MDDLECPNTFRDKRLKENNTRTKEEVMKKLKSLIEVGFLMI